MRKIAIIIVLTLFYSTSHATDIPTISEVGPSVMPLKIAPITAPFKFGTINKPNFGKKNAIVKLRKDKISTVIIQKAINKMSCQGGGTVIIPKGVWKTGRIQLKSGVCLNIPKGAELVFSGNIADYQPVVFTRDEGMELYSTGACIYANGAENIGITGKGVISGPSTDCELFQQNLKTSTNLEQLISSTPLAKRIYDGINTKEVILPKTIAPINCRNVLIEGITIRHTLYWNVVAQYCENIIIRGVTVESFGHGRTDGIDIDSSKNVLIEYCSLDCGDDTYTMKSGRGTDGIKVNRPTENVIIRYCLAKRGSGGIVCGTESAGNIKNIYMHDCVFDGTDQAFRFKTRRPRGGGIENVTVERVRATVKGSAFFVDMLGSAQWVGDLAKRLPAREINSLTPDFKTIKINDVIIEGSNKLIDVKGLPERPLHNVLINNMVAKSKQFMYLQDVNGMVVSNSKILSDNMNVCITSCTGIILLNDSFQVPIQWQYNDNTSTEVIVQN